MSLCLCSSGALMTFVCNFDHVIANPKAYTCWYMIDTFREGKYATSRKEALAFKRELEQIKKKVRFNVSHLVIKIIY